MGSGRASGATAYLAFVRQRLACEKGRFRLVSDREREREASGAQDPRLPASYYLDESDPDVLILRRQDGTFVAAFSAQGATREGIVEAAREDYAALLQRTRTHKRAHDGDGERAGTRGRGEPMVRPDTADGREDAQAQPRRPS
jgi:hypothetical protein